MKITAVELSILKAPALYDAPQDASEPQGPGYLGIVKVSTGAGICGYSGMETCAQVAKALLVDTGWFIERTPQQAIQAVRSIEHCRPYLVEELLHPEDYDGYGQVADAVDTRIACGEREATGWGFPQFIERGRADAVQPGLTRCGGLPAARKIAHMAGRANVLVIPRAWSSRLLTAASLHFAAFLRRAPFVGFSTSRGPLSRELLREPLRPDAEGHLSVPTAPGLGVEVNAEILARYRVSSS